MKIRALSLFTILILLLAPLAGLAQSQVAVTATVTSASNSAPFIYGTYTIQLVDSAGNPLQSVQVGSGTTSLTRFTGSLDSTGSLAVSLYPNSALYAPGTPNPAATQWRFTPCSAGPTTQPFLSTGNPVCYSSAVTIGGAGSYSTQVSAGSPAIYYVNYLTGTAYISTGSSYTLPIAQPTTLGGIKPDNTTITVNASTGVASASGGSGTVSDGSGTTTAGRTAVSTGTAHTIGYTTPTTIPHSGDATGAADRAAINTALASPATSAVHLSHTSTAPTPDYYIDNTTLSMPAFSSITCDQGTIIQHEGTTNDWVTPTWQTLGTSYDPTQLQTGSVRGCNWVQDSSVTPTAGATFVIGKTTATYYQSGFHVENNHINNPYQCFDLEGGAYINWVQNNFCQNPLHYSFYYNDATSAGDFHINDNEIRCSAAGSPYNCNFVVNASDVTLLANNKLNCGQLLFTGANFTNGLRIVNWSIETCSLFTYNVDFGTGAFVPQNIQVQDGHFTQAIHAFGHVTPGKQVYSGWNSSDYTPGLWQRYEPTFQAYDSFVGTGTIASHTSDTGQTWTNASTTWGNTNCGSAVLIGNATTTPWGANCTGSAGYFNGLSSLTPSSADYTVNAQFTQTATIDGGWVTARGSSSAYTTYLCSYVHGTGITAYKVVAGTPTQLGSIVAGDWANGAHHILSISVSGSATTVVTCSLDGAVVDTPHSDSSSPITAAGLAGFTLNNTIQINNWWVQ